MLDFGSHSGFGCVLAFGFFIHIDVWSRSLMGWIEFEALGFFCPGFADELVGTKAFEGFESAGEVVGSDELVQVAAELVVGFVVEALDGGVLERAVHAFDLAICPRVFRLGQPVVDVILGAGVLEGMSPEQFAALHRQLDFGRSRAGISR